ncbi:hypothetical protein BH20ACT9_BH20ACT9_13300 [soil metagenome]
MLVVDASVVVGVLIGARAAPRLQEQRLVAPPLLWPETRSALHVLRWRGDLSDAGAEAARGQLASIEVESAEPVGLGAVAWAIADEFGWAKTYDAEYLALARILACRMVTADGRLRRGASRLGLVVGPTEL